MPEIYLLGIDLGASSLKATLITPEGKVQAEAAVPVTTHVRHFGWAEQDPAEWFAALCKAVPAALAEGGVKPEAIAGIGISAGAHIPVLTDGHNTVLRPAIMWSDQRAAAEAVALHQAAGEKIIATSLNKVNPTWTLAMLAWLKAYEPGVLARAKRLYLAKDFLRHCLTGTWETDYSDAVGALMADDASKGWSAELAGLIGLDLAMLPPIVAPEHVVGGVTADAAARTGLKAGTPVVCGSNDTTVEFFGVGGSKPGIGGVKLATAGVLFLATQGPVVQPPVSCYPHIMPGLYYTATGTNSCASAHRWVRDLMFAQGGFEAMDALACAAPRGAGGLLFHPYLQGERAPYWDPLLRADFVGITISHGKMHFARAVYEGIAFSIRDLLGAARALGLEFSTIRLMGGGAKSECWRQIIADVTGLVIERTESGDASFGAALVAGMGVGLFNGPEDALARCVRLLDVTQPQAQNAAFYDELFGIYKESQAALAGVNHKLHALAAG
ncbi:xylulokinase [Acidocella aminolytica]|uniref:Xylulose kinase n=2 Tax=Acidocella TaxID=50709 RepID=A0A0D6PF85_9PROT|nr:xylulokinase [Acidocella aminolytica]GAN80021.1 xylulose kinase [Acidocella aminolytica 101 = DSM 11237]SHF08507.1 xylulokinase [Acidocella aminolytica 101 = DSM 11237]